MNVLKEQFNYILKNIFWLYFLIVIISHIVHKNYDRAIAIGVFYLVYKKG